MVDVVIVGAGAAGVGAALECQERGLDYIVLEASDRVGGRAFTDTTSLPGAWDQGCHWLHCATVNPLVPWADKTGAVYTSRDRGPVDTFLWAAGETLGEADVVAYYEATGAAYAQIDARGAEGADVPIPEVMPDTGQWMPKTMCLLGLLAGDDAKYISAQGYADYDDVEADWPVQSGYGRIIAKMAEGLPIRLNAPVRGIDETEDGVLIDTESGPIAAKAVIVTASTNVLASGAIRFGPSAAADLLPLIADVPCGAYEKIAVAFDEMPAPFADKSHGMITPEGGPTMNFQIVHGQTAMILAHIGGDQVREIHAQGGDAMKAYVLDRLVMVCGEQVRGAVTGMAVTDWLGNPWVRGSYSHAKPGAAASRYKMIEADTGRVAFAGEAFSQIWQATAHGAYQTGRDVAARVARYAV